MPHNDTHELCREAARHQFVEQICKRCGGMDRMMLAAIITRGLMLIGVADFAAQPIATVVAEVIAELVDTFDLPPFEM